MAVDAPPCATTTLERHRADDGMVGIWVVGVRQQPEACSAAGFCGGHGRCVGGRCVCREGWGGSGCDRATGTRRAHSLLPFDMSTLSPLEAAAVGFVGVGLLTLCSALLCLLLLWRRALVMRAMAAANQQHNHGGVRQLTRALCPTSVPGLWSESSS